ncbi:N-acetyltransferase [Salinicola endophyticus]|uniref:N-acetyltransferase n=1 Tax=Salinicola endophyticus TaxID=1949083 RepID=A0ABY8FHP6_9GAMM|nr:GNAT family protein [Salinicola endophyticus]WFF42344.1 N-acetyltransferase [Salinicola endophyticus]
MTLTLVHPTQAHQSAFLAAVRHSQPLLGGWVFPPETPQAYADFLSRYAAEAHVSYLAIAPDGSLIGCINLNEIVRGALQSAYLGYYGFAPHQGRGWMKKALREVITRAFDRHGLHRLEANIQPANRRSIGLVQSLGLRLEGFSPRYLRIDGEWRDHERYAITAEEWDT